MAGNEKISDTTGITVLGDPTQGAPARKLEAFPFHHKQPTRVTFHCQEFSCYCPVTGQPDYATIDIEYEPDAKALESKSLRNYLWSFRDTRGFHEDVVHRILDDLSSFLSPKWMRVTGHFNIRGGIAIDVVAESEKA
ncbi:preQ(1) synthase [bacterium]|nr:preQ(1) synthase [bacterium]